jgi:LysM repeat protein
MFISMRQLFGFIFLMLVCQFAIASLPQDSIGFTKENGKFYVKYLVEPGETIYRISTKYGIPVSDLLEENPELEKGLKVGQVLLIPYSPEKKPAVEEETNAQYHVVEKGETFFSISRKLNIPVGDLLKMNNIELKAGQKIVVSRQSSVVSQQSSAVSGQSAVNNQQAITSKAKEEKKEEDLSFNETPTAVNNKQSTVINLKQTKPQSEPETKTTNNEQRSIQPEVKTQNPTPNTLDYNNSTKKIIVIPFDPYLYFSDADDEIAAVSKMHRTKVRQAFRKRLNAYLEPKGFETIHLLGGTAKDSTTDLNKAYSSISYTYDDVMMKAVRTEDKPDAKKTFGNVKKQTKNTEVSLQAATLQSRSMLAKDEGKYFSVKIKDPNFFPFFNAKYQPDYYIFVSQFEVKTNYENCLDRARQNYERSFVTHFSIFDKSGTQISGGRIKNAYESNSNQIEKILADNIPSIAEKIMAELPR